MTALDNPNNGDEEIAFKYCAPHKWNKQYTNW